jgi:hypothetical protein
MRRLLTCCIVLGLLLTVSSTVSSDSMPEWVREGGMNTPFSDRLYITGFGMGDLEEGDSAAVEAAKNGALDDLIRKIRVQVTSSVTVETADSGKESSTSVSMVSQSTSHMKLANVDFLMEKDLNHQYTLAYASKSDLRSFYLDRGKNGLTKVVQGLESLKSDEKRGRSARALNGYINLLPLFPEIVESRTIYNVLMGGSYGSRFFEALSNPEVKSVEDLYSLEQFVRGRIDELQKRRVNDLDSALEKIVVMLSSQEVRGRRITVPALLYQNSDFTSSFGAYASRKLEAMVTTRMGGGKEMIVLKGTYWEKDNDVDIYLIAQSVETGDKLGSGYASFPASTIPKEYELEPQNADEALKAQYDIADGAIVDGGLQVEVWTNRGRNEDVLVFTGGETLTLYFKVNQPAFLQVTYNLATGHKVLLEEAFYIGMDKVNQVVRYLYDFEVVPPFGVERLMVTAFSAKPPPPDVAVDYIEGERYEVFGDTKDVVAQSRGLKKKQESGSTNVKVGEAFLTLTTMPEE